MKEESIKKMFGLIIVIIGITMLCFEGWRLALGITLLFWGRNLGIK